MSVRVLVVDNHDSFVHTLVGYLRELGASVEMVEADAADESAFAALLPAFDAVLLSPGPGRPSDAGSTVAVARLAAERRVPLLGVCLGHQAIGAVFGGSVVRAAVPMHGKTSTIEHDGRGVFAGLTEPFVASRYHSLVVADHGLPAALEVTARSKEDGTIMGLRHRELAVHGGHAPARVGDVHDVVVNEGSGLKELEGRRCPHDRVVVRTSGGTPPPVAERRPQALAAREQPGYGLHHRRALRTDLVHHLGLVRQVLVERLLHTGAQSCYVGWQRVGRHGCVAVGHERS